MKLYLVLEFIVFAIVKFIDMHYEKQAIKFIRAFKFNVIVISGNHLLIDYSNYSFFILKLSLILTFIFLSFA